MGAIWEGVKFVAGGIVNSAAMVAGALGVDAAVDEAEKVLGHAADQVSHVVADVIEGAKEGVREVLDWSHDVGKGFISGDIDDDAKKFAEGALMVGGKIGEKLV